MDTNEIEAIGYVIALLVYALLTILLLSGWQRREQSRLLALATGISIVWSGFWAAGFFDFSRAETFAAVIELTRSTAWLFATLAILREITQTNLALQLRSSYYIPVLFLGGLPVAYFLILTNYAPTRIVWVTGGFVVALLVVLAAEQLYRNARVDSLSGVGYLCIAIAGAFLFDLVFYSLIMAGFVIQPEYWASRGFVNALLGVPLALGTWRRSRMTPAVNIPRQIAFYSFGATIIAVYLVLITTGHHYVKTYGGSWSTVGEVVLIVAAIVAAAVIIVSSRTRARARVFLMKTFLQYKYDYRKEWLRFISTLSKSGLGDVGTTAVRAVAQIVNSPGGAVWILEEESQSYIPAGAWRCTVPNVAPIVEGSGLIRFLEDRQWVVDLEEMKRHPERYDDLTLDSWLEQGENWWLVVPLFRGKRLYGFIVLQRPRVVPGLNFEDHDLLRTVGSHVGMHINQAETDKRLTESRQFGAYNRLTAFLMHDLNNVIAQQSLVVKNAERFRHNPKFVDDAMDTIAHSVSRMKRLMEQLSSGSKPASERQTNVHDALKIAIERCQTLEPRPKLTGSDAPISIKADPERLTTVFEHLIRNAQDATPGSGEISINVNMKGHSALIVISDTGQGMSPEFIRERLFRPFDSTKGSESMGIGAYQARDYVRNLGGQMEVTSVVGGGTTFSIRLPVKN